MEIYIKKTTNFNIHTYFTFRWAHGRLFSPVSNEAGITLVDVDNSLGVHVKADEDSTQQVASCWAQRSHHVHDGWKEQREAESSNFKCVQVLAEHQNYF